MLTKPEYTAASLELLQIAKQQEKEVQKTLENVRTIRDSVAATRVIGKDYQAQYRDLLSKTLTEIGLTTATHYDSVLNTRLTEDEIKRLVAETVAEQYTTEYYGASLNRRLVGSERSMSINISKSGHVGLDLATRQANLSRVFAHRYPFGAQVNLDQRIMLSTAVKLEHDIAKKVGNKADIRIVKWNLSNAHTDEDICDELATDIDPDVKAWLGTHDIKANPKGLYFIEKVPSPPHPNCQCYLSFLTGNDFTGSKVERAVETIKKLVKRLLGRK